MKKRSCKEIEDSKDYPIGVFHCSPTNSTAFTRCCEVAITSREECCPSCGLYVFGWDSQNRDQARFYYAFRKSGGMK